MDWDSGLVLDPRFAVLVETLSIAQISVFVIQVEKKRRNLRVLCVDPALNP